VTGLIVVADTTPLRYLVAIEREHLLPALYGRLLIPPAVAGELNHESTPSVVRAWLAARPDWLEIRQPAHALGPEVDLDEGERQAIALAEEVDADLLLIDEWDARREAERRHLRVAGTLRVLADAANLGLTDLEMSFERLRRTNFRANPELLESLSREFKRARRE
jgi:predicted nucleic acid-binding protein